MNIIINKNKMILVIACFILLLLENTVLVEYLDTKDWIKLISVIAFVNFLLTMYGFYKSQIELLSLAFIFITCSYVFHFGQVFINGFIDDYDFRLLNFIDANSRYVTDSLFFSLNIISIISIISCCVSSDEYKFSPPIGNIEYNKKIRMIGLVILGITIPIQLYINVSNFFMTRNSAYAGVVVDNGALYQIGTFFLIGIVLLIVGYEENKGIAKKITIISVIWFLLSMSSGERMFAVSSIIIIFFTYIKTFKNNYMSKYMYVVYFFFICILGVILNLVMQARSVGPINFSTLLTALDNSESIFILFLGSLEEFGGSIYTLQVALAEIPNHIPFNYGLSYLDGILMAGINIGGLLDLVKNNLSYTTRFYVYYPFGGSYIAELYYNFGEYSYIVAVFWGWLLGWISIRINQLIRHKEYYSYSYYVMVFLGYLIWVRGYANAMFRGVIWGGIIIYVSAKLVNIICKYYDRKTV